jgi:fructose/tagatose bisphosphate aldolase
VRFYAFNLIFDPSILLDLFLRDIKAPIILQVSQGGSAYFAGKGLSNDKQQASITGAIAAAHHIRTVAKAYGVYVPFSFLRNCSLTDLLL